MYLFLVHYYYEKLQVGYLQHSGQAFAAVMAYDFFTYVIFLDKWTAQVIKLTL